MAEAQLQQILMRRNGYMNLKYPAEMILAHTAMPRNFVN